MAVQTFLKNTLQKSIFAQIYTFGIKKAPDFSEAQ